MVLEIIQKEVPARGVGYLILRDCPEEQLGDALGKGMEKLKKAGAKRVLATSLPEGEPLHNGAVGIWRLTHVHDMICMERPLAGLPKAEKAITTRQLKKAADDAAWLELVNKAFWNVPNAATYTAADLRRQDRRCGLAWEGDKLVGAYEVDLSEKTPEIAALAIHPDWQRQGYGRALLLTLAGGFKKADACALVVSTANTPAVALYESLGFAQTRVVSDWFEVV